MRGPSGEGGIAPRPDPGDDGQVNLRRSVADVGRGTRNAHLLARDHDGEFPRREWSRCAEHGLLALPVAPEYGGLGASATTIAAALQGLGYGCEDNGLIFSLGAQLWACEKPIATFGSEEQKRRYLPGLCDGSLIGAHAMSEPGSGSDAFSLATTPPDSGDEWVLARSTPSVPNEPHGALLVP